LAIFPDRAKASFCGIIYHPDDRINVTDPREVLCTFGWASSKYLHFGSKKLKTLLRCKALSYLHQYPGCPIIQELALYGLRMTRSFNVRSFIMNDRFMSEWDRVAYLAALEDYEKFGLVSRPVGLQTRFLVEDMYGISVNDQINYEKYLASLDHIKPLRLTFDMPRLWTEDFQNYSSFNKGEDVVLTFSNKPFVSPPTVKMR